MANYTALAEVGESLAGVLAEELLADPQLDDLIDNESRISLESPFDLRDNDSVRLSLYLYRIVEDASTKNQFPVPGNGGRLRKPPLTLDLHYLVTPLVGLPREQQIILGKVMQVFYDRAILEGPDLKGSLADAAEQVRVILNPVTLEETARVWQALEMSYRLSVCYVARVAMVDSRRERFDQPVTLKEAKYGEPETTRNGHL
jgi:Pvc16 N-terminal domain